MSVLKKINYVGLISLMVICFGCGKSHIKPITESSVLLAFGDSLTEGDGASKSEDYPAVLSKQLGCKVINAGKSGEKSDEGLLRLPAVLEKESPQLVILCHGGNDLLARRDEAFIRGNLERMIEMIRDSGADVVLLSPPRFGLRLKSPKFYAELAKKQSVPYNGKILPEILSTPGMKSDQIHPNAKGYKCLADAVFELIKNHED